MGATLRHVTAPLHQAESTGVFKRDAARSLLCLSALCLTVLLLSTRGIRNEATGSLQGDMPRYLMNGAYFFDVLRDLPLTHPIEYTYRYYAKYPALSLGHHPLLLGVAEVPFYAVFGMSVFSGRLTILCFMLVAVVVWFRLIEQIYDRETAFFSALLLATTPVLVEYSRIVMAEMSALAMVIVAAYCVHRYSETLRRRDALLFAVAAAASVYAKHHCVFMLPIFLTYVALRRGLSCLFSRDMLLVAVIVVLLLAPLIPMTLEFSRMNVTWVEAAGRSSRFLLSNLLYYPSALWRHLVTVPVLILGAVAFVISVARRDRRVLLFTLWIVGFYCELTYMAVHEIRFALYWIPPFCLLAASSLAHTRGLRWKAAVMTVLVLIVGYQTVQSAQMGPEYADGYEEAAQYVLTHRKGESVLFSGKVDSGFFAFFVRKHDADRSMVVLRADKTLVTSSLSRIIATQLTTPEQIYAMLHDFGTGYVVLEDMPYDSPPLELLRQEMKTERFALRKRIPLQSNSEELRGVDLVVYEYLDYTPAERDRLLQMRIPLMGGNIAVRFGDLLPEKSGKRP